MPPDHISDHSGRAKSFNIKLGKLKRRSELDILQKTPEVHQAQVQFGCDHVYITGTDLRGTSQHRMNADRRTIHWITLIKEPNRQPEYFGDTF